MANGDELRRELNLHARLAGGDAVDLAEVLEAAGYRVDVESHGNGRATVTAGHGELLDLIGDDDA